MKKFAYRILVFCIPLLGFVVISLVYYKFVKTQNETKIKDISKFESILMGDSQIQRINTDYFTVKSHNFASKSEHYYFTYQKLLQLLNSKHSIKRVIFGCINP